MKLIKRIIAFFSIINVCLFVSHAQNRFVISDKADSEAHQSAILELNSDNKGFLLPRMSLNNRDNINDPAESLVIFNHETQCIEIYVDTKWHEVWCAPEPEPLGSPCEGLEGEIYDYEIEYHGYVYKLAEIGYRCWFAENLKYDNGCTSVNWEDNEDMGWCGCYNDDCATYFDKYGYLYQWSAAMDWDREGDLPPAKSQGICPDGFHVPNAGEGSSQSIDDCDWGDLIFRYLFDNPEYHCGGEYKTASSLADYVDWEYSPEECDVGHNSVMNNSTGFSGMPGGHVSREKQFTDVGRKGYWWSSSGSSNNYHFSLIYDNDSAMYYGRFGSDFLICDGLSLRCVRTLNE